MRGLWYVTALGWVLNRRFKALPALTVPTEAEDEQCCRTYRAEADRQFEANVVVLCGTEVPIPPRFHSTQAKDAAVLILNIVLNNKNVSAYQKKRTKRYPDKKTPLAGMTGNGTFPAQEMLAAALSEKRKKRAADS